jgi:hypothetical protein
VPASALIEQDGQFAKHFTTLDTRFGATYLENAPHFTANFNYGWPLEGKVMTAPDDRWVRRAAASL